MHTYPRLTWTEEDITHWFQYQTMPLEMGTIDWAKTCELLKAQNVNGRMLTQFTSLMFSFIAIEDIEIVKHLMSSIETMLDKFGAKIKASRTVNIPREYICPITNVEIFLCFWYMMYIFKYVVFQTGNHEGSGARI